MNQTSPINPLQGFTCPLAHHAHANATHSWRVRTADQRMRPADDKDYPEDMSCEYCGSLQPDAFMAGLVLGEYLLGATDKNYKVYVERTDGKKLGSIKFYFQHLSEEQQKRFIELANDQRLKFSGGTGFYVLPFFCVRKEPGHV